MEQDAGRGLEGQVTMDEKENNENSVNQPVILSLKLSVVLQLSRDGSPSLSHLRVTDGHSAYLICYKKTTSGLVLGSGNLSIIIGSFSMTIDGAAKREYCISKGENEG